MLSSTPSSNFQGSLHHLTPGIIILQRKLLWADTFKTQKSWGAYANVKIQCVWEIGKTGFCKGGCYVSRAVCLWEHPFGKLPLYSKLFHGTSHGSYAALYLWFEGFLSFPRSPILLCKLSHVIIKQTLKLNIKY